MDNFTLVTHITDDAQLTSDCYKKMADISLFEDNHYAAYSFLNKAIKECVDITKKIGLHVDAAEVCVMLQNIGEAHVYYEEITKISQNLEFKIIAMQHTADLYYNT